ncbi:MAG TPA: cobalamin biosynthesis protein [Stellaceae bacterium]|jgi:adenosylcobinamide-phosphate synthase|nr:cobalamin biosynthesis protein [Stellaceae bacterium]
MFSPSASDPFAILLLALVIDLAFGDMAVVFRFLPRSTALVRGAAGFFDRRLNREDRGDTARRVRGAITVIAVVGAGAVIGWAIGEYLRVVHYAWAIEAFLIALQLTERSPFENVAVVGKALQRDGLQGGRAAAATLAGRDIESLDEHGIARVAIETLFAKFSTGVVAPAFWYLLFGLSGLLAYTTAKALAEAIGHRSPKHLAFGRAAVRFDEWLEWAPARLTALLVWLAALMLPGAQAGKAIRVTLADAGKHRSLNAGWPRAAAAGALGLALGGPRRVLGTVLDEPWLGDGRARATIADIGNALRLYLATAACAAGVLTVVLGVRHLL